MEKQMQMGIANNVAKYQRPKDSRAMPILLNEV